MRYRITEPFTDSFGMNWSPGDKFRAHEDDDPDAYFKLGLLEDADKPAGNNAVTPQQKKKVADQQAAEKEAAAKEKARAEGREHVAEGGDKAEAGGAGRKAQAGR